MARLDINFYSTILKREVNFLLIYPSLACGDTNNYHRNYYKEISFKAINPEYLVKNTMLLICDRLLIKRDWDHPKILIKN